MKVMSQIPPFDLSGMNVGDWFLGCPYCFAQYITNAAANPVCWNCGKRLNIYTVSKKDIDCIMST